MKAPLIIKRSYLSYFLTYPLRWPAAAVQDLKGLLRSSRMDERIFCINSGNCGSQYITELMKANGFENSYHEKAPDLDEQGIQYYLDGQRVNMLKMMLRVTRSSVFFESSNRLFSLAPLIREVFPNARFIHLYRNGRDVTTSTMNKTIWPDVMSENRLRYTSLLAGEKTRTPFERTCIYWRNYNERIFDDLSDIEDVLYLKFENLVAGDIDTLELFLGKKLANHKVSPANTKERIKRKEKRFESYDEWPDEYKETFEKICGHTMRKMGYE